MGQAGGPTAVINTSLVGFLDHLGERADVYGVINGYQGLAEERFIPLTGEFLQWVKNHRDIPGACLGGGRYPLSGEKVLQSVLNLKKRGIDTLVFIGGNGTMAALHRLNWMAASIGYDLQVIGIPKTVDNDLVGTDHAPGFGSAARYVALSVRDISKDLESMCNFEQVRIIETMGRNAGWLAAASGLLKESEKGGPHLVCTPEVPVGKEQLIRQVQELVREYGMATIVVSEGTRFDGRAQVKKGVVQGRSVLGGISKEMEKLIHHQLGVVVRAEILGMNQRCSSMAVSEQDRLEAYKTGEKAAELLEAETSDVMVSIQRGSEIGYTFELKSCPLKQVVDGGERLLPLEFITDREKYRRWLRPLTGSPIPSYPPALPRSVKI